MSLTIPAVVSTAPIDGKVQFKLEQVTVPKQPGEGELLVRMVAVGICHTDIFTAGLPEGAMGLKYPKILGHEGAGEVEAVGPGVTVAKPGDKVLLSYTFCDTCDLCIHGKPTYCEGFALNNMLGQEAVFKTGDGKDIAGKFFGQSSFAALSLVSERCVVNVEELIQTPEEFKRCAPLGCGLMTGAGAVMQEIKSHDILFVVGIGAVGCGVIMTAKIVGCKAIIAVDRVASRLETAKELGATHIYNTSEGNDFVKDIQALVDNKRIGFAIDTTGVPALMEKCLLTVGKRGKLIQIGVPGIEDTITLPLGDFFFQCKSFEVNYLGDSRASEVIPKMIKWYKEGKFPIDKIIKFYRVEDINLALEEMKTEVIKPVLKF